MYSDTTTSPQDIILIKAGELVLKGLNKGTFEDILLKNLRRSLAGVGEYRFSKAQSTIYVKPVDSGFDMDEALKRISRVFGIAAYSVARTAEKNMDDILRNTVDFMRDKLLNAKTFKVEAKRSDKSFELKSPEICAAA
ncbi:MAG TPA: THUMP domain-containing protein, partial [Candidatus Avimonas sp.]|nr:THUMP domain-containing protein [Candidatus Avimonas sp.]